MSHGYHGTSIRFLFGALEISKKQFYDELGGKKGLVKILIASELSRWERIFGQNIRSDQHDGKQILKRAIDELLNSYLTEGTPRGSLLANLSCELSMQEADIQETISRGYGDIANKIAALLPDGGTDNLGANKREVALFILGALEGSLLLAKADKDFWEMKNGFEITKRFIDNL